MLRDMKRCAWCLLTVACLTLAGTVRAETETIDLKALAKKARPAVMLLVVSDATGKEIATGTGFLVSSPFPATGPGFRFFRGGGRRNCSGFRRRRLPNGV